MAKLELKQLRILVIDDEAFVRTTICQILTTIGIGGIYEAADAKAALAQVERLRPHLVFCDIHMPGADGLAFVRQLHKTPDANVSSIPVVMLTSDNSEESVMTAKGLKVQGYLIKPVSIATVKRAIERALDIPQS